MSDGRGGKRRKGRAGVTPRPAWRRHSRRWSVEQGNVLEGVWEALKFNGGPLGVRGLHTLQEAPKQAGGAGALRGSEAGPREFGGRWSLFSLLQIPMSVLEISSSQHPVKAGLSDAFMTLNPSPDIPGESPGSQQRPPLGWTQLRGTQAGGEGGGEQVDGGELSGN